MSPASDALAMRVALVDDDSGLVTVLERRFVALGWDHQVLAYAAGPDQITAMRLHALIVNPALTGVDYVERIAHSLPGLALIVCSGPAPVAERVRALRGGADDWLTKPCHPEELVARLQAILRRRRAGEMPPEGTAIGAGELAIRPDRFDAFVGDQPASLSRKEFELLHQLAIADGRVLEREDIYQRVWGYTMVRGDRSVDVFVRKLRQKLERLSPGWRYVHTHFGVGYRFAAEPTDPASSAGSMAPAIPSAEPSSRTAPSSALAAEPLAAEPNAAEPVAAEPYAAKPDAAEQDAPADKPGDPAVRPSASSAAQAVPSGPAPPAVAPSRDGPKLVTVR